MAEINDWKEVKVDDWQEVPVGNSTLTTPSGQEQWPIHKLISGRNPTENEQVAINAIKNFPGKVPQMVEGVIGLLNPDTWKYVIESAQQGKLGKDVLGPMWENSLYNHVSKGDWKDWIQQEPVQALADASVVLSLLGKGSQLSGLTKTGKILSGAGEISNPMAIATAPIGMARSAIGSTHAPEWLMGKSLKMPPGSVREETQAKVINTMLEGKVPVTRFTRKDMDTAIKAFGESFDNSLKTLSKDVNVIGDTQNVRPPTMDTWVNPPKPNLIADMAINKAPTGQVTFGERPNFPGNINEGVRGRVEPGLSLEPQPNKVYFETQLPKSQMVKTIKGEEVNVKRVLDAIDSVKSQFKDNLNADKYFDVIDQVKDSFIQKVKEKGGRLTLYDANQIKKSIYKELDSYYSKMNKSETGRIGIRNDEEAIAKLEGAKALRDEILSNPEIPSDIKANYETMAGLLNARKWVERATNRGANLDPVSLSGMLFGLLVDGGMPTTIAYRIGSSQQAMSRLSIFLKHGSDFANKYGKVTSYGFSQSSRINWLDKNKQQADQP